MYSENGIDERTGGKKITAGPLGRTVIAGGSGLAAASYDIARATGEDRQAISRQLVDQGFGNMSLGEWGRQVDAMGRAGKLSDGLGMSSVIDTGRELGVRDRYTNRQRFADRDPAFYAALASFGNQADPLREYYSEGYGYADGGAIPAAPMEDEEVAMPPQSEGEDGQIPVPMLLDTLEILIQKLREQL